MSFALVTWLASVFCQRSGMTQAARSSARPGRRIFASWKCPACLAWRRRLGPGQEDTDIAGHAAWIVRERGQSVAAPLVIHPRHVDAASPGPDRSSKELILCTGRISAASADARTVMRSRGFYWGMPIWPVIWSMEIRKNTPFEGRSLPSIAVFE
jgi:hypothetical protein